MYTFKTFLVLAVASHAIAAPPAEETAECKPIEGKEKEVTKCCKLDDITKKEGPAAKECLKLVKNKDDKPLKIEGYECFDDCVMTKVGLMGADKKIDVAKVKDAAKATYTGDWADVGTKMVEKCLAQAAASKQKEECTSGSDVYMKCLFREAYMNCPEKSWTNSDACKANIERLKKCPKSLPFVQNEE